MIFIFFRKIDYRFIIFKIRVNWQVGIVGLNWLGFYDYESNPKSPSIRADYNFKYLQLFISFLILISYFLTYHVYRFF